MARNPPKHELEYVVRTQLSSRTTTQVAVHVAFRCLPAVHKEVAHGVWDHAGAAHRSTATTPGGPASAMPVRGSRSHRQPEPRSASGARSYAVIAGSPRSGKTALLNALIRRADPAPAGDCGRKSSTGTATSPRPARSSPATASPCTVVGAFIPTRSATLHRADPPRQACRDHPPREPAQAGRVGRRPAGLGRGQRRDDLDAAEHGARRGLRRRRGRAPARADSPARRGIGTGRADRLRAQPIRPAEPGWEMWSRTGAGRRARPGAGLGALVPAGDAGRRWPVGGAAELRELLAGWADDRGDRAGATAAGRPSGVTAATVSVGAGDEERWQQLLEREIAARRDAAVQRVSSTDLATIPRALRAGEPGHRAGLPGSCPTCWTGSYGPVGVHTSAASSGGHSAVNERVFTLLLDTAPTTPSWPGRGRGPPYGRTRARRRPHRNHALLLTATSAVATVAGATAWTTSPPSAAPSPPTRCCPRWASRATPAATPCGAGARPAVR